VVATVPSSSLRKLVESTTYDISAESSFAAASAALQTHEARHGRVDGSVVSRIVVDGKNPMLWDAEEHYRAQKNVWHEAGKVR
jgi:hypothetical protein